MPGIDVLTSLNIQHIESLNDQVWHVTGVRVRETVPDWVVQEADEVVMVDVTPRALLHRLERGVVYPPEKAEKALENFFTESNLTALRELAMRQTAQHLEEPAQPRTGGEKILIWLTPHPATAMLIRRGRRVADYLNSTCTAVALEGDAKGTEQYVSFCRNLRIDSGTIGGRDRAMARAGGVCETARDHADIRYTTCARHCEAGTGGAGLAGDYCVGAGAFGERRFGSSAVMQCARAGGSEAICGTVCRPASVSADRAQCRATIGARSRYLPPPSRQDLGCRRRRRGCKARGCLYCTV